MSIPVFSLSQHARVAWIVLLCAACDRSTAPRIAAAGNFRSDYGLMAQRGIELAVADANSQRLTTKPIELVVRDDSGQGETAATIAGELLADQSILAVVGHVNSGTMVAAAPIYDQGLPAISPTATSPDLTGMSPWVFRVISSDSVNGEDLAAFAQSQGLKRAAILYENNAYGRGLAAAFQRQFRGSVVVADPISASGEEIEPNIAFVKSRQPDVLFVAGTSESGAAVLREAARQSLKALLLGSDGWSGIASVGPLADGAFVATPFTPRDPRPAVKNFVAAFRAKYDIEPDGYAALGYDAAMVAIRAIADGRTSRSAIRDWIAGLNDASAIAGVTGTMRFHPTGDVIGKRLVMTRASEGVLVPTLAKGRAGA